MHYHNVNYASRLDMLGSHFCAASSCFYKYANVAYFRLRNKYLFNKANMEDRPHIK